MTEPHALSSLGETFEHFTKRILAAADTIAVNRGQQRTTLSKLSERDRLANIDRWFLDGIEPPRVDAEGRTPLEAFAAGTIANPSVPPATTAEKRAEVNRYPVPPGEDPETFYGWVQRALVPGPGFEWAMIEIPRHIVEGLARSDRSGRKIRADTREVMTGEIIAQLADWNLGNRVRGKPECKHRYFWNPADVIDFKTGKVTHGRSECVQCGTPEGT